MPRRLRTLALLPLPAAVGMSLSVCSDSKVAAQTTAGAGTVDNVQFWLN